MTMTEIKPPTVHVNEPHRMPKLARFQQAIALKCGDLEAAFCADKVQFIYDALYETRPIYQNPHVQKHVDENILPGLAVYRALLSEGMSKEQAVEETYKLMTQFKPGGIKAFRVLKHVPGFRWVFRNSLRRMIRASYPSEGWDVEWVEDSPHQMKFSITRCLYLDVLASYNAPELCSAFCRLDNIISETVEPVVHFERTGTLGTGSNCCDFCYRLDNEA